MRFRHTDIMKEGSGGFVTLIYSAWQAIRQLYPRATVKGCVFHWNQRVYRKVLNEGLATAYAAKGDKFLFLRKLMSLPYLPSEHIIPAFEQMMLQAEEVGGPLLNVVHYVERTWIHVEARELERL
ncbi:hypothetical protein DPMN_014954 [Dreissena polymorpha]|uniref:MULE transposase domain-containing protein n=1 Tax=Dreissena polymorpha TaxID=45954 RepID=A0A9D4S528_DREPO|nr:hypothetical protein DPMN_014954 [Dreissena polymorpha]